MLKGISPILSPELLKILMEMDDSDTATSCASATATSRRPPSPSVSCVWTATA